MQRHLRRPIALLLLVITFPKEEEEEEIHKDAIGKGIIIITRVVVVVPVVHTGKKGRPRCDGAPTLSDSPTVNRAMELFFFFRPAALSTHYDIIISLYPSVLYFCSSKKLYLLCVVYISGRRREAASPAFTPISSPFCFFFFIIWSASFFFFFFIIIIITWRPVCALAIRAGTHTYLLPAYGRK